MAVSWSLRATLPAGSSFDGQIVYNSTALEIPNTLKSQIDSISIDHSSQFVVKYTGFEGVKHRIANTSGTDVWVDVTIQLIGSMTREWGDLLKQFAVAVNGGGMYVDFYDDIVSTKQYTCRWINAAQFAESTELQNTGRIDLECWKYQDI